MNEFLRSSPNPVVASVSGNSEIFRRAAVRRGYPVMKSQSWNFGDDIHDQSFRERVYGHGSKNLITTVGSGISESRMVAHSQLMHLSSSERAD